MANRQGISGAAENADLENRLIKMETKAGSIVSTAATDNISTNSPSTLPNVGTPPEVTGISILNRIPGAISVKWSPLDISIIDRYDVWVSSNTSFPAESTFKYRVSEKANSFTFTEGNPDTTYYIAIRGVAGSGRTGPWSSYVNLKTGQATKFVVDRGAFSVTDSQEEIFPDVYTSSPNIGKNYGALVVDVATPGTVLAFGKIDFQPPAFYWVGGLNPGVTEDVSLVMATSDGNIVTTRSNKRFFDQGAFFVLGRETVFIQDMFYIPTPGLYTFGILLSQESAVWSYKISVVQLVKAGKVGG